LRKDSNINAIDFDSLTDEQVNALFRPRKANSFKSLTPLYVYLILKDNKGGHLTQAEISKRLEENYEVKLERKALSRVLHCLDDAGVGIVCTSDSGSWFEAA